MTQTKARPIGGWIATYTGRQFHFDEPNFDSINIVDIAHALSNLCRFNGHTRRFYSVAEHSIKTMQLVRSMTLEPNMRKMFRTALMHDATEAYLGDMVRPLKRLPSMKAYREMEQHLWHVMANKWELYQEVPPLVKEADETLLVIEGLALLDPEVIAKWNLPYVEESLLQIGLWEPNTSAGKVAVKIAPEVQDSKVVEEEFLYLAATVGIT